MLPKNSIPVKFNLKHWSLKDQFKLIHFLEHSSEETQQDMFHHIHNSARPTKKAFKEYLKNNIIDLTQNLN